ncbi:MAG: hypothetical protein AB8G96_10395 [Phycisphaerales bacterium]
MHHSIEPEPPGHHESAACVTLVFWSQFAGRSSLVAVCWSQFDGRSFLVTLS